MRWSYTVIVAIALAASVAGAAIPSDPAVYNGNCGTTDHGPGCSDAACSACVCDFDPKCCDIDWSFTCLQEVPSAECSGQCYKIAGNCAEARMEPGCSNAACEACVCGNNPVCCMGAWTFADCVLETVGSCFPACELAAAGAPAPALSMGGVIAAALVVFALGVLRLRARR